MIKHKQFTRVVAAALALASISTLGADAALAQATYFPGVTNRDSESRAGHGEFTLSYQHGHYNGGTMEPGIHVPNGRIDAHVIYPQIDYSVTDRLSLQFGVPLLIVRYRGDFPHPSALDDGSYHADIQDFQIGARYRALDKAFRIEPFVLVTIPSHHYTTFAHGSIGQRLHKGEIGSTVTYFPPFDDYYVAVSLSHVFAERPLGHNVNHWKSSVEAGYYLKPNFVVRVTFMTRQGKGLSAPEDFPPDDHDLLHEHDRLFKSNYTSAGAGFDWRFDKSRRLSVTAFHRLETEDAHILKYGLLFTLGQSF